MKISILHNGEKSVANCIMGPCTFIVTGATYAHISMAPTIERCGSLNHIWNEKIREDNQKSGKTSWTICQMPT
jgi:hypothetical protein